MRARLRSLPMLGLAIALVASLLVGCGGASTPAVNRGVESSGSTGASSSAIGLPSTSPAQAAPSQQTGSGGSSALPANWDRKIVRNAQLTLTVGDVEQELAFVRSTTTGVGGQVISSSTSYDGDRQVATVGIEVPSEQFDSVMTTLRGSQLVRKVEQETTSSQDVTGQYVDLQAELANDQATLQRFLALQQQATAMTDILAIEQQISRVQGEIEQLQGRINFLDHTTSYSQINLTLQPVGAPAQATYPTPNLEQVIANAWAASMRFVGRAVSALVTVVVFLWWLWLIAAVGWAALFLVRSRRRSAAPPPNAA